MPLQSTVATNRLPDCDEPAARARADRASRIVRLVAWTISLAAIWLVVLPWLAAQPAIEADIHWLDERGIDPSAMYYTELEAMKPILKRFNDRQRRRPAGDEPKRPAAAPTIERSPNEVESEIRDPDFNMKAVGD